MRTKFILLTFGDNDFYQEFNTIGNIVMEDFYNNKFDPNLASNLFLMFPNLVACINSLSLSSYNAREKFRDLRKNPYYDGNFENVVLVEEKSR